MSLQVEKLENNTAKLTIEVPAEEVEKAIESAYQKSKSKFSIPGFRKGKVPRKMIEKMYGVGVFYEDAVNSMIPGAYADAATESELEIVAQPEIDIVQIEAGKPFIFTAEVVLKPEVELGKYKGIEVEAKDTTVTDEEVDAELAKVQEQNSRLVAADDKEVENGDQVTIDFEGFVDGVAFEGGKAEGHELEIGSGAFIPGFEDQLVGMKIDEEKEIKVTFPKEYFSKDLAGKEATFKVKLHEIKKKELPNLDDEFAKDVSEFDTLKELEASIKERLEKDNAQKAKYETEEAAIKAVCDKSKVEIPSGMVDMEVDHMIQDINQRLSYQGLKLEQYLKMIGKTEEEVRKEYEPQAIEAIKSRLTLEAVRKAEKIEATDEEINAKLEEMAKNYGKKVEEINDNENLKDYIKEGIESEKAIDFIVKNAKIK